MTILEAIQKGKEFRTKSGYKAKFVALLSENIPAPLLMSVDDSLENYYINGMYIPPVASPMDLIIDGL